MGKSSDHYSPTAKVLDRFQHPRIQGFLTNLRAFIKEFGEDPQALEYADQLLSYDIAQLRKSEDIIKMEYDVVELALQDLFASIFADYAGGKPQQFYLRRHLCNHVVPSEDDAILPVSEEDSYKKRKRKMQKIKPLSLCDYVREEYVPVTRQVLDTEYLSGDWVDVIRPGYRLAEVSGQCPKCSGAVSEWSTANVWIPTDTTLVSMVIRRVKNDGGTNSKLTEVLCYEGSFKNPGKLRHLDDGHGMAVLFSNLNRLRGGNRRRMVEFTEKHFDRKFLRSKGLKISNRLSPVDKFYYAAFCRLREHVDGRSLVGVGRGLDDHIADPIQRWSMDGTERDYWTGIREAAKFRGYPFEIQFVPEEVWIKGHTPGNPLFHESYSYKERTRQNDEWEPRHWRTKAILDEVFNRAREYNGNKV